MTLNRDRWTPGLCWSLWQWYKEKKKIPCLKVTLPTLHSPRRHFSPYWAPGFSGLTSALCPGKKTPRTGRLSRLCCTVGLALFVVCDWQHSDPCFGAFIWPHFDQFTLTSSNLLALFFFTSSWNHDRVCSVPHYKGSSFFLCTSFSCPPKTNPVNENVVDTLPISIPCSVLPICDGTFCLKVEVVQKHAATDGVRTWISVCRVSVV